MTELRGQTAPARLALRLQEAAGAIGVSDEFFDKHVRPEIRIVRRGSLKLVPVSELQRWLDRNAAYVIEVG